MTDARVPDNHTAPTVEQHSMEQVIAHLARLRTAIQDALDERFGPRIWRPDPGVPQFSRHDADGEDPGTQTVSLGTVYVAGRYPASLWHAAADTVAETAEEFGFTELVDRQESSDGICITARHPGGHSYEFGVGVTTVLSVHSGPAIWAGVPYTSASQVSLD